MIRPLSLLRAPLFSRFLPPAVLGCFFLIYLGLAFTDDDALVALLALTRQYTLLAALLALVPLNLALRGAAESVFFVKRRRMLASAGAGAPLPGMFDEETEIPLHGEAGGDGAPWPGCERDAHLSALGYRVRRSGRKMAAWRGVSLFPARLLFLAGACALFAGIVLSVTMRVSHREALIEGEPLPGSTGDLVARIALKDQPGTVLARTLAVDVSLPDGGRRTFGIYPPALYRGFFVYPRYLGVAPRVRFAAPDLPSVFETYFVLMLYPPGKEDGAEIPGTPYRILFKMENSAGADPYLTGNFILAYKVLKGQELLWTGSAPVGGEGAHDGYRIGFPDCRRVVAADLVRDPGVWLIWGSAILLAASLMYLVPVRLFFPRREMLFVEEGGVRRAFCRAEGDRRRHFGVFHEELDILSPPQRVKC